MTTSRGFLIAADGRLFPLPHSTRRLSGDVTDPAQIAFTPDGTTLIVTEKATNHLDTYRVSQLGLASGPDVHDAPGSTPFGFAFGKRSQVFVSAAFAGVPDGRALSSLTVDRREGLQVISPSIGTNQTAACWVVVTNDGRFAFVTNTGSGTISSYNIAFDGTLTLLDSVAATTAGSVIDLALSSVSSQGAFEPS